MTATITEATQLTGQMIIAGALVTGTGEEIRGFDPASGTAVEPGYREGLGVRNDAIAMQYLVPGWTCDGKRPALQRNSGT